MTAQRDEAQKAIEIAKAKMQEIQVMIADLTIVSPRNGVVQYKLKQVGETVAAGEAIVTVNELTDIYMVVFLHAADASRLVMGDQARVILDAVPEYVIPSRVRFVASDCPRLVERILVRDMSTFSLRFRLGMKPA